MVRRFRPLDAWAVWAILGGTFRRLPPSPPASDALPALALLFLLLLSTPLRAAEGSRSLTVEEAVPLATIRNLGLSGECLEYQATREALSSAWGAFDPVLSSSFSATESYASPPGASVGAALPWGGGASVELDWLSAYVEEDGRIEQQVGGAPTVTVSLSQPLLRGFLWGTETGALRDAGRALEISSIRLEQSLTDLAAEVEDAYWAAVEAREDLAAAEQSLEFSRRQEAVTEERIAEGFQASIDILQVREQRSAAEARVEEALARRAGAEDDLRVVLALPLSGEGSEPLALVSRPDEAFPAPTLEEVVAAASREGFGVRQAERALARARISREYATSQSLPDLSASGSATYVPDAADPTGTRPAWEWGVGASLSVPLTLRSTALGIRAARREVRAAELALRQARQEAERAARAAFRAVRNQERQVELSRERIGYAERKLDAEKERLERGDSTLKNVLDFLVDRDQARRDEISARIDLRRAQIDLLRVEGRLLQRYGVDLRRWLEGCGR